MKLVLASQMRAMDKAAIEGYKIPSLTLMERAGQGVAEVVKKHFKKGLVAVVVGKGNNGGDGLVAARYLKEAGFDVSLYLTSPWTEFSPDARVNWDRLAPLKITAREIKNDPREFLSEFEKAICIIDAIFGTGLGEEVKGRFRTIIEFINSLVKPVVAVDMPSGLSADTGEPLGVAIRAKFTATFGLSKLGLHTLAGAEYARHVEVIDIGIPREVIDKVATGFYLTTPDIFSDYLGPRRSDSHKGDYGHVLVVAGSVGKIGAGLLTCRSVLRSGAGLVTYALRDSAFTKFDTKNPEIMYEPLKTLLDLKMTGFDVLAIGPGLGTEAGTKKAVLEIVKRSAVPTVIDADGLNCLVGNLKVIDHRGFPIVLTPHPGEMGRLVGKNTKDIQADRIGVAKRFAIEHHVYVVLKGHRTITATPTGVVYINPTGNPGMATAGMGDVLTGVIAGFIAQKLPIETAVVAAVYLHALAGDTAAGEVGERGLIASDVIANLPRAIKEILVKST